MAEGEFLYRGEFRPMPQVEVPVSMLGGVFERPQYQLPIEVLIDLLPHILIRFTPWIEKLVSVGRFGAYPESFKYLSENVPFDNVYNHVLRCIAIAMESIRRVREFWYGKDLDKGIHDYFWRMSGIGFETTRILLFLHDLGELSLVENSNVSVDDEYVAYLRKTFLEENRPGKVATGPTAWDFVRAAVGENQHRNEHYERRFVQDLCMEIDEGDDYLFKVYVERFILAAMWLRGKAELSPLKGSVFSNRVEVLRNAVTAKITDLADGNTCFHLRLKDFLAKGGLLSEIKDHAQRYTFDKTKVYLERVLQDGELQEPEVKLIRLLWITLLYEQIKYIEKVWHECDHTPPIIAEGIEELNGIFEAIMRGGIWCI